MNAPEPKRRSFHLTPGWLVVASIAISVFLLLAYKYQWTVLGQFKWEASLYLSLYLLVNVGVTFIVLLLWFIVALLSRQEFQFTVRTLLLLAAAVALPFGWFGSRMRDAERQQEGIALVKRLGGVAHIDQLNHVRAVEFTMTSGTLSDIDLREIIRLMPHIKVLTLSTTSITDERLESLNGLKELRQLNLSESGITDSGLEHLAMLSAAGLLSVPDKLLLVGTKTTEAGVNKLRRAWSSCAIWR